MHILTINLKFAANHRYLQLTELASKWRLLDRASPSYAPASTKNPPFWEKILQNFFAITANQCDQKTRLLLLFGHLQQLQFAQKQNKFAIVSSKFCQILLKLPKWRNFECNSAQWLVKIVAWLATSNYSCLLFQRRVALKILWHQQCDQIGQFIALWATFLSLWQQLLSPNCRIFWQFVKWVKNFHFSIEISFGPLFIDIWWLFTCHAGHQLQWSILYSLHERKLWF